MNRRTIIVASLYSARRIAESRKLKPREVLFVSNPQQLMGLHGPMTILLDHNWRTILGPEGVHRIHQLAWLEKAKLEYLDTL